MWSIWGTLSVSISSDSTGGEVEVEAARDPDERWAPVMG